MGAKLEIGPDFVTVLSSNHLEAAKIDARPYPFIPTDLQAFHPLPRRLVPAPDFALARARQGCVRATLSSP